MSYLEIPSVFDNFMYCAGKNSCNNMSAVAFKTTTDLIYYIGSPLPCTPVAKCETLTDIIQNIEELLCPEKITETIINTLIENSELFDIICRVILRKCIDCEVITDCVQTNQ